jgi:hypothetical protein
MKIILIGYFALFVVWLLIAIISVYHNIEYYEPKSKMKYGLYGFAWASVFGIVISFYLLYNIDWSSAVNLSF